MLAKPMQNICKNSRTSRISRENLKSRAKCEERLKKIHARCANLVKIRFVFLARLGEVQEELLYYPLALALASASALAASALAKC